MPRRVRGSNFLIRVICCEKPEYQKIGLCGAVFGAVPCAAHADGPDSANWHRIPQSLDKHRLCILLNSFLKIRKITRVHKCSSHTISRQRMRQQVISTSVNSLCSYNMITCTSNVLKRISNGSSPGSYRKSCHSPFQCSHTLFKNTLCGISQTPIMQAF